MNRFLVAAVLGTLIFSAIGCTGESFTPGEMYARALAIDAMGFPREAGHWYRKAAHRGHPLAQLEVGFMYRYGRTGFLQDPYEAERWFGSATRKGSFAALADFGFTYVYGKSGVLRDDQEAERWFRKAAASCRKAAERGNLEAQTILGGLYGTGTGVTRDPGMAIWLWQDAAARGYAPAQYRLARAYWYVSNYEAAWPWMVNAAEQDLPEAQYQLSVMYQAGYGVEPDQDEAVYWLYRSASQGYLFAQRQLRSMEAQDS